jgi:small subunit ribosomal protein S21
LQKLGKRSTLSHQFNWREEKFMKNDSTIMVIIDENRGSIDSGIKRFKRLCESAGILKEYKKRKEFRKPSIRKKEKCEAAQKRKAKEKSRQRRFTKI